MKRLIFFILISCTVYLFCYDTFVITTGPDNINFQVAEAVIREAYKLIGVEVVVEHTSQLRSLSLSSSGKSDAELSRASIVGTQYPDLIMVNVPILIVNSVAFSLDDISGIESWESLKNLKVGYERGIKATENNLLGFSTITVNTLEEGFDLLLHKRVDCIVTGYYNGLNVIKSLGVEDDIFISKPLVSIPLYHYVNVKHKDLVPLLEKALMGFDHSAVVKDKIFKY